jgi:flagellin-like protein
MCDDEAVSEIIGSILLIGIIVAAFGIFSALYLPGLIPGTIPRAQLSMACSDDTGVLADIEYPCARGSFQCSPLDNKTCEDDCQWRDYSVNTDLTSEQYSREIARCKENCVSPICSDTSDCRQLYICHNGGDPLLISDMMILINGDPISWSDWKIKRTGDTYTSPDLDARFQNGDVLRITRADSAKVENVMILYSPPSGGTITLVLNHFGTSIP